MKTFLRPFTGVIIGCAALLGVWPDGALAQTYSGPVIRVMDGDTLELLEHGKPLRVRLAYIDAPEKGQPFSEKSRQQLAQWCAGQTAVVTKVDTDRYGRTVGEVQCQGQRTNQALVQAGLAWVYRKYTPAGHPIYADEARARAVHQGLWLEPAPTPPWEWRKARRKGSTSPG